MVSEMENTADHLIVIGKGKLIADCPMAEFIARSGQRSVRARTPQPGVLAQAVSAAGGPVAITLCAGHGSSGAGLENRRADCPLSRSPNAQMGRDYAFELAARRAANGPGARDRPSAAEAGNDVGTTGAPKGSAWHPLCSVVHTPLPGMTC
jgi:hypothetical protein